ncbi:carbohydrate esterase family 3 protein [Nemania sp. FL0031]|nr:carbohydrate esterase family 3 protein [Nemania sp. FL0031]
MATFTEDRWNGFVGIVHSRRTTTLLALLLITISLMTYSLNETVEFNTLPYHGAPSINHASKDAIVDSQQPQEASSPHNLLIPEPAGTGAAGASYREPLPTKAAANPGVSTSTPLLIPLGGGVPLCISFLDASGTRGLELQSTLRDRLATLGNPVKIAGVLGTPGENDVEPHAGGQIDQIYEQATHIIPSTNPNVFVLSIGTDGYLQKRSTVDVGEDMRDRATYLLQVSPQATVILSTLAANPAPEIELRVLDINIQIRKLASTLQREGRPVVLAEMHYEQGLPDRPLPADIAADGLHPSDHGYALMTEILFSAFVEADRRGFLNSPEEDRVSKEERPEGADDVVVLESETPAKRTRLRRDEKYTRIKVPEIIP